MKAHIINTNQSSNLQIDMLKNQKCAAYYGNWKKLISTIKANDMVFLYSNGKGIIARGVATGIVETADYQG
ncbi:hypothetical protein [Metabacillus sp. RGM 3146]|uniref:hypothetical protein n=1 Tax=Metabacillus sp. RGM 3146 TaxID=3401092 RepID=UPI003B9D6172